MHQNLKGNDGPGDGDGDSDGDGDNDDDDVDDAKIVVHPKHFTALARSHRQVAAALEAKEVLSCFQLSRVFSRQRTILHRIHGSLPTFTTSVCQM